MLQYHLSLSISQRLIYVYTVYIFLGEGGMDSHENEIKGWFGNFN